MTGSVLCGGKGRCLNALCSGELGCFSALLMQRDSLDASSALSGNTVVAGSTRLVTPATSKVANRERRAVRQGIHLSYHVWSYHSRRVAQVPFQGRNSVILISGRGMPVAECVFPVV